MTQVIVINILLVVALDGESPQPTASAAPVVTITPMALRRPIWSVEGPGGCIFCSMPVVGHEQFVYDQSMNVERHADAAASRIAAAIGEPARARILYCLMDGHARTS